MFLLEAEMYQRKALVARVEDHKFSYDAPQKPLEECHCTAQREGVIGVGISD